MSLGLLSDKQIHLILIFKQIIFDNCSFNMNQRSIMKIRLIPITTDQSPSYVARGPKFLHADGKDSDQNVWNVKCEG